MSHQFRIPAHVVSSLIKRIPSASHHLRCSWPPVSLFSSYYIQSNNISTTRTRLTPTTATLGYYDIRGMAQPIRLLLEYTGMSWVDKLYITGPAPTFDKTLWWHDKATLGFDFPNLPYFIDGDVKLTQSGAILRYIARKYGLAGKTEEEIQRVDLVEGEMSDIRGNFSNLVYDSNFESLRVSYLENIAVKINELGKFLGQNAFFAGKNLTYVDFIVYETLDQHRVLEPSILNKRKNLQDFICRIENLKQIQSYMKSDRFIRNRLNNRMAYFGA